MREYFESDSGDLHVGSEHVRVGSAMAWSPSRRLGTLAPRKVHHVQLAAALHGGAVVHDALRAHVEREEAVAARRVLVHLRLADTPPLLYVPGKNRCGGLVTGV